MNNVGIATKWPDYFLNDSDQVLLLLGNLD